MAGWVYDYKNGGWNYDDGTNSSYAGRPHYQYGYNTGHHSGMLPYYSTDALSSLLQQVFPGIAGQLSYSSGVLEPARESAITNMMGMLTNTGANNRADAYQNAAMANAGQQAQQQTAQIYGGGYVPQDFAASAALNASNNAVKQGNAYRAQVTDPYQNEAKRAELTTQGMSNPLLTQALGLAGGGEQARPQGGGFLGALGGILGQVGGMGGFGNIFGGGGGGGGNGMNYPWIFRGN